jgi:hypothetical protein
MSVLDLNNLVKALEEKFGVSAAHDGRSGRRWPRLPPPPPSRSRPSSRSPSRRPARRRSTSSRRSAKSLASASRRPRTSSRALRSPQGIRLEGRGRRHQEEVRRDRRQGRGQVVRRVPNGRPSGDGVGSERGGAALSLEGPVPDRPPGDRAVGRYFPLGDVTPFPGFSQGHPFPRPTRSNG